MEPLDRLDHLYGQEEEELDEEALALQRKGKGKGIKGNCFNCGKQGRRAADSWSKGGGKEGGSKGPNWGSWHGTRGRHY